MVGNLVARYQRWIFDISFLSPSFVHCGEIGVKGFRYGDLFMALVAPRQPCIRTSARERWKPKHESPSSSTCSFKLSITSYIDRLFSLSIHSFAQRSFLGEDIGIPTA